MSPDIARRPFNRAPPVNGSTVRAGFRPMSPDSARRPRHRCPSALQSPQPFAPVPRRLAGFVASPSKTALQAVRDRLRRNQRQASATVANIAASVRQSPPSNAATVRPCASLSGKPWRFDVRRLSAVRKSAPDSAATVCRIPASVRRPSAACQRFDRPRRIRRQPIRQRFAATLRNISGKPSAPPIFRACIL